jgi:hypothetical protein
MRDLTPLELEAVGGGRMAPAPRPRIDFRRLVLAIITRIFGRPTRPAPETRVV